MDVKNLWRYNVRSIQLFVAGHCVFLVEVHGVGEAFPERWVADAGHGV